MAEQQQRGPWAPALAPGSAVAKTFEELLRQRIDRDYELDDDLVNHILEQLRHFTDKQELYDDLEDVFGEEGAGPMSTWCWSTLERLTNQEPSEPGTPPAPLGSASPAAAEPGAAESQDAQQPSKRAPIRFNLEESLPETAPKRASDHKAQELGGGRKHATPEPAAKEAPKAAAAAAPPSNAAAADRTARPVPISNSAGSGHGRQRAAPGASARMLHMTGLIRPAADQAAGAPGAAGGSRDGSRSSARPRPQERGEPERSHSQQQQQQHRQERDHQAGRHQQPEQQQREQLREQSRKRPLEDQQDRESGRPAAAGLSRRGAPAAGAAAATGSMFRSAVDSLKQDKGGRAHTDEAAARQPQAQQQQRGGLSVFDRIDKADLEKLGVQQQRQQQPQHHQQARAGHCQQQHQDELQGLPKSLQGRLGMVARRPPVAATGQGSSTRTEQQVKPSVQPAGAAPAVVGMKRKVASAVPAASVDVAERVGQAAAKASRRPAAATEPKQQQQVAEGAPAKKSRTAPAPAAAAAAGGKGSSSAAAELAALRAQLEARQAEVQRLKLEQDADQRSVVVFGVSPRVPDSVVAAHFGGCGSIKRISLLPGRLVSATAPGAYIEFQGGAGGGGGAAAGSAKAAQQAATNALRLSGTMLLDQPITVTRKSDWKANQAKGYRAYTAAAGAKSPSTTAGAAAPSSRSWKASTPAGGGGGLEVPCSGAAAAAGVAES